MKTIHITSRLWKCGKLPGFFLIFLVLSFANGLRAQANPYGKRYYEVLSSSASELLVSITPEYKERTVTDNKTGEEYTQIDLTGGTLDELTQGEPALEWLRLPILLPSNKAPKVEVVEAEIENIGVSIAPVPSYISKQKQFVEVFEKSDSYLLVNTINNNTFASVRTQGTFRTSYSGDLVVTPMRYDAKAKVLSRVNKLVLRITYERIASQVKKVSTVEASFFKSGFVNGNVSEFYHSAISKVAPSLPSHIAYKGTPQAGETWIAVKTTDEGVYRVTSGNLQQYGISSVDASTISLYGFGGMPLPEKADSMTGEFQEVAIDVRTDGSGNFQELRFFAPGTTTWGYRSEFTNGGKIFNLYHERNPYSANGMFYLKVGGAAKGKRMATQPDVINSTPKVKNKVFTSYVYEKEERFEIPNISREFLGEVIPLGRDVTVSISSLPGYTPDSVLIRPAVDAKTCEASTISVKVNNSSLGIVAPPSVFCSAETPAYLTRDWGTAFALPSTIGMPQNFAFQATSNDKSSKYWLNFIEIFYLRKAELNEGQVPFMLFSDTSTYRFTFSNAATGEIWDISDHKNINRIAEASGASMSADIVGKGEVLRRFITFSDGNLKSPELSTLSPMKLRPGICQTGAQDIIITTEAFLGQAQKLAAIRERGGQATNPLTTAIVTVEDIYREFGYGAKDVTAIRDFLAYTFRSTIKNSSTVPLFATLFGNGHADYMNRVVQIEQRVPVYETNDWASVTLMRKDYPDPVPDDVYFVRLTATTGFKLDIAIGRITVQSEEDAENFVRKTEKYETSSDPGSWRARTVFVTDDRYYTDIKRSDPINHLTDSEREIEEVDPRLLIDKLYSHVYPHTTISGGQRRKPEFEKQIVDAFNSGAVLISYAGHGNPNVWTNESVLNVPSTINKLSNFNRLAFTTTATCDFSEFDNCNNPISGGVQTLTKPDGGCI
ncbi:MAG TPA: C25 family cysteine peptidase, partial [Candidatus Kapabacteria bacterium]